MIDCKIVYWNGDVAINCSSFKYRCVSARRGGEEDKIFISLLNENNSYKEVRIFGKTILDAVRQINNFKGMRYEA